MPASTSKGSPPDRAPAAPDRPRVPRRGRRPTRPAAPAALPAPQPSTDRDAITQAAQNPQPGAAARGAAAGADIASTPPGARSGDRAGSPSSRRRPPERSPRRSPRLVETTGPDPGTALADVRLVVGTLVGAHGVRGELKLRLTTDDPAHLATVQRVWVGAEPRPRRFLGLRMHAGQALIRLQGVGTREAAEALRGAPVRIAGSDARPNEPGEFFLFQLVGLNAVDETGTPLGRITDIIETGAHDVFVVTPADGGPDMLLPNHPDVVLDVRPAEGRMVVRPLVYE